MSEHAKYSPSAASRWIACPGSIQFDSMPEETSAAAERGTYLHDYAARRLLGESVDGFEVSAEEVEMVSEYVAYVKNLGGNLMVERRVHYDSLMWGTADALVFVDNTLHIIDFKSGAGVKVPVAHNYQMMAYALCVLNESDPFEAGIEPQHVVLHVVQPAIRNIDSWAVDFDVLNDFEGLVCQAMEEAESKNARFVPGEKQCRWCKGAAVCRARAEHNLHFAVDEFELNNPIALSAAEIANVLDQLGQIEDWLKAVDKFALKAALNDDVAFPGYKLVEGRSQRRWSDDQLVIDALTAAGVEKPFNTKPIGIGEAEKVLGKKHLVFALAVKPEGAPVLAPVADPRPVWKSADF